MSIPIAWIWKIGGIVLLAILWLLIFEDAAIALQIFF